MMSDAQPQIIEHNGKRFILDAAGRLTPIIFEPFPTQQAFLNSTADVTLFGGSRGPGKSAAILPEAMQFGNIPGYKALIMRRTFPRLKELLDRAAMLLPQFGWKKSEYDFKHPDGGIIRFGHCFDDQTEILCKDGWKLFKNLCGEAVATVNESNEIIYTCDYQRVERDYCGPMHGVHNQALDFLVTPEHRFRLDYKSGSSWRERQDRLANDLPHTFKIKRAFKQPKAYQSSFRIFQKSFQSKSRMPRAIGNIYLARLLGWYLSEGCLQRHGYKVYFYQKKFLTRLQLDIENCGLRSYTETAHSPAQVARVVVSCKELHEWLSAFGHYQKHRRIPSFVFEWSEASLLGLYDTLMLGDGKHDGKVFITSSKGLSDDFQQLCLHIGKRTCITEVTQSERTIRGVDLPKNKCYRVNISDRQFGQAKRSQVQIEHYDGKVYCVNVRPYHTIIVRRNTRPMLSLNCEYEDNVLNYQGHEYQRIYIDQVEEFTKSMFDFLSTCCRSTIPSIPARIKLTANPGGVGHHWVKTLFIDNCPPAPNGPRLYNEEFDCWWQPELPGPVHVDEVGLTYSYIPAKVFENPFLLQNDKAYVLRLKKLPEDLRKAHLDGRWDVHIGQFFKEFDPQVHVLEPWPIPKHWLRYVSLDYGAKRPFVALFHAVNPKSGELITYNEYWARDKTLQYHGSALAHLFAKENSLETIFYPHDMHRNERRDEAGFDSIVETLIDYIEQELGNLGRGRMGLSFEKGVMGPHTRVMKWSKMRDALAKPWWYIFKNCEQLVRTLPMMSYGKPEKDGASSDDIAASDMDHWVEAASHAIVHVPRETEQRQKRDDYGFRKGPYSGGQKGLLPKKHWLLN